MKKEIVISYEEFDRIEDLNQEDRDLLGIARQAMYDAYAPYSGFMVGSAVLLNDGEIQTGNNQENMAYSPTICGERVAMFAAAAVSKSPIKSVAISCCSQKYKVDKPSGPCGVCRQVMSEYEMRYGQKIRIILQGEIGKILIFYGVENLLPFSFDGLKETF